MNRIYRCFFWGNFLTGHKHRVQLWSTDEAAYHATLYVKPASLTWHTDGFIKSEEVDMTPIVRGCMPEGRPKPEPADAFPVIRKAMFIVMLTGLLAGTAYAQDLRRPRDKI